MHRQAKDYEIGYFHIDIAELRYEGGKGFLSVTVDRISKLVFARIFGRVCRENGIEHRLTKPYHPWTNGQTERMVRTIKDATVKSFHYTSINELRRHVRDWLTAYNFAKQLKALKFRTPYEAIEELWKSKPDIFNVKPDHHMLGLNT